MRGYVVGAPQRDVYGVGRARSEERGARPQSRLLEDESPPERPSWGFGPSRYD